MADSPASSSASRHTSPTKADTKSAFYNFFTTRRTMYLAYGFSMAVFGCTIFLLLSPSGYSSLNNFLKTTGTFSPRSHFSSFFSHLFPNSSNPFPPSDPPFRFTDRNGTLIGNRDSLSSPPNFSSLQFSRENGTSGEEGKEHFVARNESFSLDGSDPSSKSNVTNQPLGSPFPEDSGRDHGSGEKQFAASEGDTAKDNSSAALTSKESDSNGGGENSSEDWLKVIGVGNCNIFEGTWVRDDSYPLYAAGSCPHIDEPFNCFLNGRPERGYENYRWQPKDCNIPRLNGKDMLQVLRGKRLVFIGDSLNRNMWESLVCILRNSVEDKSRVCEASGRVEFRSEGSYSFIFLDYNCSVEFFRTPFLVQEWEMPDTNGAKKETLRLDVIEGSSDRYKSADILVFNTGHWWTHEKTAKGKGYYQEGNHVYSKLNVKEAFRKALATWGRWIDANVNPTKTFVFFRGYSRSHFRGGRWNNGGQCDRDTEPIKNQTYLRKYPSKMRILESVMMEMKTPVFYLNITRLTGFRKDAHPSLYRKQNLTEEEKRLRYQDCSHWCLPGVPDTWNELFYAQLLIKHYQKLHQQQNQKQQQT